jgi:hypothetical protein
VTELSEAERRDLVYAVRDPDAIFIPRVCARDLAAVYRHGHEWATWGQARAALSAPTFEPLHARADHEPADEDPLDLAAETGDFEYWPKPAVEGMLDWLPPQVFKSFGEIGQPLFGAAFARIHGDDADEAAAALRELGYRCEEDDGLVLAALGEDL